MTKTKQSPSSWTEKQTRPCPTGKCKHRHVKGSGPCIETGCGCRGKMRDMAPSQSKTKKGGR